MKVYYNRRISAICIKKFPEKHLKLSCGDPAGNHASFDEKDEFTYINKSGEYATENRYDYAESFVNGRAKVVIDGKERYINNKFQFID